MIQLLRKLHRFHYEARICAKSTFWLTSPLFHIKVSVFEKGGLTNARQVIITISYSVVPDENFVNKERPFLTLSLNICLIWKLSFWKRWIFIEGYKNEWQARVKNVMCCDEVKWGINDKRVRGGFMCHVLWVRVQLPVFTSDVDSRNNPLLFGGPNDTTTICI